MANKHLSITIPPPSLSLNSIPTPLSAVPNPPSSSGSTGTTEFPLIPKRRRRTTPHEMAILEEEFLRNPLPTPAERGRIAERVGMTPRGVQVWLQNRRQKEKKESSSYHPGSASGTEDDRYSFYGGGGSSSPLSSALPSPALLSPSVLSPNPFNIINPFNTSFAGGKENANSRSSLPAPSSNYVYTYQPKPSADSIPPTVSTTAVKKHTKKRPLGSHAPLARKPSLANNFNFPDSPPATLRSKGSMARLSKEEKSEKPGLKRQISIDCLRSIGDNLFKERERDETPFSTSTSTSTAGPPPPTLRTLSLPLPTTSSHSLSLLSPSLPSPLLTDTKEEDEFATPSTAHATIPEEAKDEVWQHMLSDPPQTSSPVPFFRQNRPKPSRSLSTSAMSMKDTLKLDQHNRAGVADSCAERALERKRARIVEAASASASASLINSASRNSLPVHNNKRRKSSSASSSASISTAATSVAAAENKRMSVKAAARLLSHAASASARVSRERRASSSTMSSASSEEPDLSFGSTTTEGNVSIGAGTPPPEERETRDVKMAGVTGDDERECAELLLGLGGFM